MEQSLPLPWAARPVAEPAILFNLRDRAYRAGEEASAPRGHRGNVRWVVGKVTKFVDDEQIEVEIADGVRIRQMRQMAIRRCGRRPSLRRTTPSSRSEVAEAINGRYVTGTSGSHALHFAVEGICDRSDNSVHLHVRDSEPAVAEHRAESWPKWAQRHVVLDLSIFQGGSHLLLEVDTSVIRKQKVDQLAMTSARCCCEARRSDSAWR